MIDFSLGINENKPVKNASVHIYLFDTHEILQLFVMVWLVCIQYIEITHSFHCKSELYICLLDTHVKGKTSLIMDLSERLEG